MTTMNQLSEQQANKSVLINENFEAVQPAALFGVDRSLSIGLLFAWYGGILYVNGTATVISAGTIALSGSQTNYLERTLAGVVSTNTSGFTAGRIPLYTAVTNTLGITTLTDHRTTNYEATGRLTKSVAGGAGDTTLTAAEARNRILHFTGALTGNRNIIVPAVVRNWVVFNATSGAFSLTVKTAAGTGVAVTQSSTVGAAVSGDGTNVLEVGSSGSGEVNTASNVGAGGVGLFKQKVGADLQFKNIIAADSAITVTDEDSPEDEVAIGLDQDQIRTFVGDDDSPATPESGFVPAPQPGDAAAGKFLGADGGWSVPAGGGSGDVVGPAGATDSAIALFDTATGKLLKDSAVLLSALMGYADSRYFAGSFTNDLSVASGNQAVTGVGFSPKAIIFLASVIGGNQWGSIGFSTGSGANRAFEFDMTTPTIFIQPTQATIVRRASGNYKGGVVASLDVDGFTMTFTKVGTPTGTQTINFLALR